MEGLKIVADVLELLKEFEQHKDKESIVAHDADLLDQIVLQIEYFCKNLQNHKI